LYHINNVFGIYILDKYYGDRKKSLYISIYIFDTILFSSFWFCYASPYHLYIYIAKIKPLLLKSKSKNNFFITVMLLTFYAILGLSVASIVVPRNKSSLVNFNIVDVNKHGGNYVTSKLSWFTCCDVFNIPTGNKRFFYLVLTSELGISIRAFLVYFASLFVGILCLHLHVLSLQETKKKISGRSEIKAHHLSCFYLFTRSDLSALIQKYS
jgi:hypothetical protein